MLGWDRHCSSAALGSTCIPERGSRGSEPPAGHGTGLVKAELIALGLLRGTRKEMGAVGLLRKMFLHELES